MKANELSLNPHKARHWFVTSRLREIHNISNSEAEIEQRKNELVKYMKWKNPDTIKTYEHHFDEVKHREAHDRMLESMEKEEKEYEKQHKTSKKSKPKLQIIETINSEMFDADLQELLEGLE